MQSFIVRHASRRKPCTPLRLRTLSPPIASSCPSRHRLVHHLDRLLTFLSHIACGSPSLLVAMDSQSYYTQPLQAAFPDSDGLAPKVWAPPNPNQPVSAAPTGAMYDAAFPNSSPPNPQQQWQPMAGSTGAGGVRLRQSPPGRSSIGPSDDAAFSSLMSNPLAQAAFTAYGAQVQKQMSGLFSFLNAHKLKYYFHVNNRYVLNKLYILLLPFTHKHWKRQPVDSNEQLDQYGQPAVGAALSSAYKPPSEDVNAPDLYIPTMAFFTYILLMSYAYAATHAERTFDPELIGVLASSTLVALLLETALCRFGLYLISADNVPHLLDLLAFLSYKYVHAIVCISLALSGGSGLLYWAVVLVMGGLQGLFMMRTMKRALTPVIDASTLASPAGGGMGGGAMRSNYLLLIVGALQIVIVAFLVRGAV